MSKTYIYLLSQLVEGKKPIRTVIVSHEGKRSFQHLQPIYSHGLLFKVSDNLAVERHLCPDRRAREITFPLSAICHKKAANQLPRTEIQLFQVSCQVVWSDCTPDALTKHLQPAQVKEFIAIVRYGQKSYCITLLF